ncbi:LacI family DNA-binding transcriptional regulator [Nocardioides sp. YIM B13467]|uniref:LacI family DNA-binding transcriptional regulator n=1 Tax=Nocardioides sp. YIM B13467 TaxID=3366294 RepID=UPI00366AA1D2
MTDTAGHARSARATIRDVAREAGVSTSTVSRVLDERLPPSRNETAERVREVAARLGYRKDSRASALRRQQSGTIGVLVPRLTDTVMAILFENIAAAAAERQMFAIVATTADDPNSERSAVESLLNQHVDGLVLTTARPDDTVIPDLRERGVPLVLALRHDGVTPAVVGDDELGGYLATRHLLDLGHREIALVAGPAYATSAAGRVAGFRRAMTEAGIDDIERHIHPSTFGMESGEEVGRRILSTSPRPTAVFAVNDNTAVGVLAAARAAGLSVPDQLSVVGYNDIPLAARLPVPLTTVHVPFDQIAARAVAALARLLTSPDEVRPGTTTTLMPSLIPRASTAPPRGARDPS